MSQTEQPTGWFDRSGYALSVEDTVALEKVCNAFEAAWRAGARSDIPATVVGLAEPLPVTLSAASDSGMSWPW